MTMTAHPDRSGGLRRLRLLRRVAARGHQSWTNGATPWSTAGRLPPELVAEAKRAARDCPRRAITLRERKGGH